jgi:PKD repeat protein
MYISQRAITILLLFIFISTCSAQEIAIGNDSIEMEGPIYSRTYSYSQTIYKQKWIHAVGEINKLTYNILSELSYDLDIKIFMGHTTVSNFEDDASAEVIPNDQLSMVYDGAISIPATNGELVINLTTPFNYNNTDNLVIAFDINSVSGEELLFVGSMIDNEYSFFYSEAPSDVDPSNILHGKNPSYLTPNTKIEGALSIQPYHYILKPNQKISTSKDSSIVFSIESDQSDFTASCEASWLNVIADPVSKTITATVSDESEKMEDWFQSAEIILSADGIENDTAYVSQYRFESYLLPEKARYFCDFDSDNDIDLLGYGQDFLVNNGLGKFVNPDTAIHEQFPCYFADYDNDGDLDFLYKHHIPQINRNDGDSIYINIELFIDSLSFSLYETNATPWCDYDNDGDLDLLIHGTMNSDPLLILYTNMGNDIFINSNIEFRAVQGGAFQWIDYNQDGYFDLMVTGSDISRSPTVSLYKNQGSGIFRSIEVPFPKTLSGKFDWGDYDADGDEDLVISGFNAENGDDYFEIEAIQVFRNDGKDLFTKINTPFDTLSPCFSKWIDLDNDGDLDMLMNGTSGRYISSSPLIFYENRGQDEFVELYREKEIGEDRYFHISTGNFDADGDLDLLLTKKIPNSDISSLLYRNNTNNSNTSPQAPVNYYIKREGTKTIICWDPGEDAETPSKALKYNIRIGSSPGKSNLVNPHSDLSNGIIKSYELINCSDTLKVIDNFPPGTYYFSVQSVDNMHAASPFSPEQTFEVKEAFSIRKLDFDEYPDIDYASGDYDNDGDYDILLTASIDGWTGHTTEIYINNGDSTFSESGIDLPIISGMVEWGDYDNDNDLDILLAGEDQVNPYQNFIFRNNGDNTFTDINYQQSEFAPIKFADINNDGFQDVISINGIFTNLKNDTFRASYYHDDWAEDFEVIDVDNDFDLDIVSALPSTIVYLNDQDSMRSLDNNYLKYTANGFFNHLDYNNDNLIDLIISGTDTTYNTNCIIYENLGSGNFSEVNIDIRAFAREGELICGDFNSDGESDLIITGVSYDLSFNMYSFNENISNGYFNEVYSYEPDMWNGKTLDWIDYNGDGHLDILTGYSTLFSNNATTTKEKARAPQNLSANSTGFDISFSWERLANPEFSYNMRVGTTPGGTDVFSPMADVETGFRKILATGNAQKNNSWMIRDLTPGETYYWSVQAIDASFFGGNWAKEQSFVLNVVWADFTANNACHNDTTYFTDISLYGENQLSNWQWYFGDGDSSNIQNPAHLYELPGTYEVTLIVSDGEFSDTTKQDVFVRTRPSASFIADPVCDGELSEFTNTTDDRGLAIDTWLWDFGDGYVSNERNPGFHGFLNPGDYLASLQVMAENGCIDSLEQLVSVGSIPIASISSNAGTEFCAGDSIILSNAWHEGYQYQWVMNETALSNSDTNNFIVKSTGDYKIKITNPIGSCVSYSEDISVIVHPTPTKPSITADLPAILCEGDSVILSIPERSGIHYHWYLNSNPLGENDNQLVVMESGNYTLTLSNEKECFSIAAEEISLLFRNVPVQPVLNFSKKEIICSGGDIAIKIDNPDSEISYSWSRDYNLISGTGESLLLEQSGLYQAAATNNHGCRSSSETVEITVVNVQEEPRITILEGAALVCPSEDVILSVENPEPELTYQWKKDAILLSSTIGNELKVEDEGTYSVLTLGLGCNYQSDSIEITFKEALPKPGISAVGTTLWYISSSNDTANYYRWYFNDGLIEESGNYIYVANQRLGEYFVEISNTGDCYTRSDIISIPENKIVGITENPWEGLKIYPNPTPGLFTLEMDNSIMGELEIDVFGTLGNSILNIKFTKETAHFRTMIDLSGQPAGAYLIGLFLQQYATQKTLIIE